MTTKVDDNIFLDTNVLVYAATRKSPYHHSASVFIEQCQQRGNQLWISRQVIREYLAVLSRPQTYTHPLSITALVKEIDYFSHNFHIAEDNQYITEKLLQLVKQFSVGGKQVHDANITATMLTYGISTLSTYNVTDFEKYTGLIRVLTPLEK